MTSIKRHRRRGSGRNRSRRSPTSWGSCSSRRPSTRAAVDFLEALGVPAYKIASFELVDTQLIERAAATGKPVILSTGMATREEIADAIAAARTAMPDVELALLKCTSSYPASPEHLHLRTIVDMAANFDLPIGLSDHTVGIVAPVTAVALGACIVEKHLCLNRADGGPDAHFSLEPHEFEAMVHNIREAEVSLGKVHYGDQRRRREPGLPAIALRRRRRTARVLSSPRRTCGRSARRMAWRPRSYVA